MGLQEKKERTKLTIQRKAIDLTLERGLAGFTMQELADAADVSRSTLFNYFPSKADAVLVEGALDGIDHEARPVGCYHPGDCHDS